MKKEKAICYYRVSSEYQKEKQNIKSQKKRLKEFADEKNYHIEYHFEDKLILRVFAFDCELGEIIKGNRFLKLEQVSSQCFCKLNIL